MLTVEMTLPVNCLIAENPLGLISPIGFRFYLAGSIDERERKLEDSSRPNLIITQIEPLRVLPRSANA